MISLASDSAFNSVCEVELDLSLRAFHVEYKTVPSLFTVLGCYTYKQSSERGQDCFHQPKMTPLDTMLPN